MADPNRNNKLIFITGAHGVGKSTICKEAAFGTGFNYFKASDLIFTHFNRAHSPNKQISNLDELYSNQCALVKEVSQLKRSGYKNILLEGHTCLLSQDFQIEQIPIDTFYLINISAIVIVTRSIEELYKTILLRDHVSYSLDIIQHLQDQELTTADLIAKELSIPFLHMDTSSKGDQALSENAQQLKEFLISV